MAVAFAVIDVYLSGRHGYAGFPGPFQGLRREHCHLPPLDEAGSSFLAALSLQGCHRDHLKKRRGGGIHFRHCGQHDTQQYV